MKSSKDTLQGKIEIIDRNLNYLNEVRESFKKQTNGYERLQAVKHSLFEIAEACIDMAGHIVAAEGYERTDTYAGLFQKLSENKIIPAQLSEKLAQMARFRNLLVHHYHYVEKGELLKIIEDDLPDVKEYVKAIYSYMGE